MPLDPRRRAEIAETEPTIAGKVRALASEGATRREIADHLGRSYQQVRQVLVEDERRRGMRTAPRTIAADGPATRAERTPSTSGVVRLDVAADGSVLVPGHVLTGLEIRAGTSVMARVLDGELILTSTARAMQRAQDLVRSRIPASIRLSDELLADRRRDAGE